MSCETIEQAFTVIVANSVFKVGLTALVGVLSVCVHTLTLVTDSETFEGQVFKEPLDGTLPHEDQRMSAHAPDSVVDEPDRVSKVANRVSHKCKYLRLGCAQARRVLVCLLKVAEKRFAGGSRVCILP